MPKYKIKGSLYEPSSPGADAAGYLIVFDVVEAENAEEAEQMFREDYGEYVTTSIHGTADSEKDEEWWLANNPEGSDV